MNILICDDKQVEIDKFTRLIGDSYVNVQTVSFNNGYDVLDYIHTGAVVDVCFLDIVMPEMNGIELAQQLREAGYAGDIVFFTTSNEYASESYGVNAFAYLLKPLVPDAVRSTLYKLDEKRKKNDTESLLVKVSKVARNILFREISHIEVIRNYVYFRLTDGEEIKFNATFGEIAPQFLADKRFVQCHRSYVVNMSDIKAIDDNTIIMRDGKKIPNSKSYPDVKKKFTKWVGGF